MLEEFVQVLDEYVKDKYYARFHLPSYDRCRETLICYTCHELLTDGRMDGRKVYSYIASCYKQVQ